MNMVVYMQVLREGYLRTLGGVSPSPADFVWVGDPSLASNLEKKSGEYGYLRKDMLFFKDFEKFEPYIQEKFMSYLVENNNSFCEKMEQYYNNNTDFTITREKNPTFFPQIEVRFLTDAEMALLQFERLKGGKKPLREIGADYSRSDVLFRHDVTELWDAKIGKVLDEVTEDYRAPDSKSFCEEYLGIPETKNEKQKAPVANNM